MDTTLLLLGIACIIASIVGGGLKAAGFEFPVFHSLPRQLLLALLGLILIVVSRAIQPTGSPPQEPAPHQPEHLEIDYHQRGGNFVIIGPNPGGVFAQSGYWWNEIDIVVQNDCSERVYIEPGAFRLHLSSQSSTEHSRAYSPTTRGTEYQPDRLVSGWLEPNSTKTGRLIFEVKPTQDELAGRSGQYRILRYRGRSACPVKYAPY